MILTKQHLFFTQKQLRDGTHIDTVNKTLKKRHALPWGQWIQNKTLEMVRAVEEWRNWTHRGPRNPFVSIHILTTRCALSHHWLQKSMGKDNGFIAGYRFPYNQIFPVFSSISKICSYLTCHFKKWKVFQGFKNFPGDPVAKTLHSQCRGLRFHLWSGN